MATAARRPGERVFVGLGSNLGNRLGNLRGALAAISEIPGLSVAAVSPLYETEPVGNRDQPQFVNAVIEVDCRLSPAELLAALQRIERRMGRVNPVKWGPRVIDLDLLYYGERVLRAEGLVLPHPEAARRAFVLEPLAGIAPGFTDPVERRTVRELLARLDRVGQAVARIADGNH
ncbi:MAG: 2-amino-4-hydroxy-6-hydroxymethyldihydropteridine diphosphokinase [Candidatus Edwardsbacteria bacterium]|jgi:2-amino-4-hydroxy-6-hydroxymethyldihydropteridine diphosphokinase|nr:2-amino-4-hydroxy-6-hydroxymethyldihydropteridine diphosphokinase [Candidatus Edwardsbacteria bacterium]